MRYVSLFSGVEAATLAWEPLGWEPIAFCEIDPFPSAVLQHHWPDVPNLGDITKVEWGDLDLGAVDLVVGGSPCQSYDETSIRDIECYDVEKSVWHNCPSNSSAFGTGFQMLCTEKFRSWAL